MPVPGVVAVAGPEGEKVRLCVPHMHTCTHKHTQRKQKKKKKTTGRGKGCVPLKGSFIGLGIRVEEP